MYKIKSKVNFKTNRQKIFYFFSFSAKSSSSFKKCLIFDSSKILKFGISTTSSVFFSIFSIAKALCSFISSSSSSNGNFTFSFSSSEEEFLFSLLIVSFISFLFSSSFSFLLILSSFIIFLFSSFFSF